VLSPNFHGTLMVGSLGRCRFDSPISGKFGPAVDAGGSSALGMICCSVPAWQRLEVFIRFEIWHVG
jgi:hypothetical protein